MIDNDAFLLAKERVLLEERVSEGFTVLNERALHKTLKLYLDPDITHHERELSGYVADIFDGYAVTEVQTGGFLPLLPKLTALLSYYPVTLAHPIITHTAHKWLDTASGEIIAPTRRGSSHGAYISEYSLCEGEEPQKISSAIHSAAFELYKISELIPDANFRVRLIFLECEEFRRLDGRGRDKRRGATLIEKLPTRITGELVLKGAEDYLAFLPRGLSESFTSAEFLRAIRSRSRYDVYSLRLLCNLGLLTRKKEGRAYIYTRKF